MIGKGIVERWQRLAASAVLILSAFFFVTVRWSAVSLVRTSQAVKLDIDWSTVLPADWREWWVLVTTVSVVAALNLLYPWFRTFGEQPRRNWFLFASLFTNLTTLGF